MFKKHILRFFCMGALFLACVIGGGGVSNAYAGCGVCDGCIDCTGFCDEDPNCIPTPVPTVSEWGLIIFTLLLLTGGTLFIMRQPATMSAMGGGSLRSKGGNPLPFVPTVFIKASTITGLLVLFGFAIAFWLSSPPSTTDIVGTSISAPIFAYLLHLLMLFKR